MCNTHDQRRLAKKASASSRVCGCRNTTMELNDASTKLMAICNLDANEVYLFCKSRQNVQQYSSPAKRGSAKGIQHTA